MNIRYLNKPVTFNMTDNLFRRLMTPKGHYEDVMYSKYGLRRSARSRRRRGEARPESLSWGAHNKISKSPIADLLLFLHLIRELIDCHLPTQTYIAV